MIIIKYWSYFFILKLSNGFNSNVKQVGDKRRQYGHSMLCFLCLDMRLSTLSHPAELGTNLRCSPCCDRLGYMQEMTHPLSTTGIGVTTLFDSLITILHCTQFVQIFDLFNKQAFPSHTFQIIYLELSLLLFKCFENFK